MNNQRPVFLNLFQIKQFITAIVSILHRISGVILLISLPFLLWALSASLASPGSFSQLTQVLASPVISLLGFIFLAALLFHLVAGFRHIMMDLGFADSLAGGRRGAITVIVVTVILIVALSFTW